jgi:hypothetical protein
MAGEYKKNVLPKTGSIEVDDEVLKNDGKTDENKKNIRN